MPFHSSYYSISEFLADDLNSKYLSKSSQMVFDKYYSGYLNNFNKYLRYHYSRQTEEVTELIKSSGLDVLEVGAGCGSESIWFALIGANVTAIDISDGRLNCAMERRNHYKNIMNMELSLNFKKCSIFDLYDDKYDVVWMEQTYHHVEPRGDLFEKLNKLLNSSGKIIICEINGWNPLLQLQFFLLRGFKTIVDLVDSDGNRVLYGNERITTPFAIKQLGLKSGFVVRKVSHFRLLPNWNPPSWFISVEICILKLFPFLSTHFVIVLEKVD